MCLMGMYEECRNPVQSLMLQDCRTSMSRLGLPA